MNNSTAPRPAITGAAPWPEPPPLTSSDRPGDTWRAEAQRINNQPGISWRERRRLAREPRARAAACEQAATTLARLLGPHGWIIRSNQQLVGTAEVLDHVLIGPDGLTLIQVAAANSAPHEVNRLHSRILDLTNLATQAVSEQLARIESDWLIPVHMSTIAEPLPMFTAADVAAIARHRLQLFGPLQVHDLADVLDDAFTPGPCPSSPPLAGHRRPAGPSRG